MSRLIDADALVRDLVDNKGFYPTIVRRAIETAPTVDAVEVVHGEWKICSDGYYPYCSNCQREPQSGKMTDYCPNCGAKMDGEKHE